MTFIIRFLKRLFERYALLALVLSAHYVEANPAYDAFRRKYNFNGPLDLRGALSPYDMLPDGPHAYDGSFVRGLAARFDAFTAFDVQQWFLHNEGALYARGTDGNYLLHHVIRANEARLFESLLKGQRLIEIMYLQDVEENTLLDLALQEAPRSRDCLEVLLRFIFTEPQMPNQAKVEAQIGLLTRADLKTFEQFIGQVVPVDSELFMQGGDGSLYTTTLLNIAVMSSENIPQSNQRVRAILAAGADPDRIPTPPSSDRDSAEASTYLDVIPEGGEILQSTPPLIIAVAASQHNIIQTLLDGGANPNITTFAGVPALHFCATNGDTTALRQLAAAGASLVHHDADGNSFLDAAGRAGQSGIVDAYVQHLVERFPEYEPYIRMLVYLRMLIRVADIGIVSASVILICALLFLRLTLSQNKQSIEIRPVGDEEHYTILLSDFTEQLLRNTGHGLVPVDGEIATLMQGLQHLAPSPDDFLLEDLTATIPCPDSGDMVFTRLQLQGLSRSVTCPYRTVTLPATAFRAIIEQALRAFPEFASDYDGHKLSITYTGAVHQSSLLSTRECLLQAASQDSSLRLVLDCSDVKAAYLEVINENVLSAFQFIAKSCIEQCHEKPLAEARESVHKVKRGCDNALAQLESFRAAYRKAPWHPVTVTGEGNKLSKLSERHRAQKAELDAAHHAIIERFADHAMQKRDYERLVRPLESEPDVKACGEIEDAIAPFAAQFAETHQALRRELEKRDQVIMLCGDLADDIERIEAHANPGAGAYRP